MTDLLGINLDAYSETTPDQTMFDFANTTQENLAELNKALQAGKITGRDTNNSTTASGSPLKVESLDSTLKVVTFRERDIVSWKRVPKDKAFNTVEEYNQLDSYGADRGGFIVEGELPQNEDSIYIRRSQLVKFLGVVKSVTHVMTLVNTMVGNVINRESQNGTLWILRQLNRSIFTGDSNLIPQEFNGMYHQHARPDGQNYSGGSLANYLDDEIVIDMRGKVLTESAIEDAAEIITENFGSPTELFAPPKVISNYTKQQFPNKLIQPGTTGQRTYMGQEIPGQITDYGTIDFTRDIFLRREAPVTIGQPSAASTHPKAPATPVPDGSTPVALVNSDATSKFASGDAGDYFYAVRAINRFGKSAVVALDNSAVSVAAANNAVDLTFAAGSGGEAATAFQILRSAKNGVNTKFFPVFEISAAELASGYNGASAGSARDRNFFLPETDSAMLLENSPEVWQFKQLAPLMKMDLAITSPAYRFMLLMYGTLLNYAPRKQVRFINIGNETS